MEGACSRRSGHALLTRSLRQQAAHPDLAGIPAERGGSDRIEAIAACLPVTKGKVLDIGCGFGYMCHRFEDMGFDCIASEADERSNVFLAKLRDASKKRFEVRSASFLEGDHPTMHGFDLVIALDAFHPSLEGDADLERLASFPGRLQARHMIPESPAPCEASMAAGPGQLAPDEFVEFVMRQVGLSQANCIYEAPDGRAVFLLT